MQVKQAHNTLTITNNMILRASSMARDLCQAGKGQVLTSLLSSLTPLHLSTLQAFTVLTVNKEPKKLVTNVKPSPAVHICVIVYLPSVLFVRTSNAGNCKMKFIEHNYRM
jgi:hypothetical protein